MRARFDDHQFGGGGRDARLVVVEVCKPAVSTRTHTEHQATDKACERANSRERRRCIPARQSLIGPESNNESEM